MFYKGKLYVGVASPFRNLILQELHSSPVGGHSGFLQTLQRIQQNFYWPNMRAFIKQYIRECETCQRNKSENVSPAGLLQPLPIPQQI